MKNLINVSILLIMITFFTSCSDKKDSNNSENLNYTKEILNGITTTTNENISSQPTLKIELKKVTEIVGLNEESSDSTLFSEATNIQMDRNGNIYIFEYRKSHIYKYSSKGELLKIFGRKGTGPGEFSNTYSFIVTNEDSIYIPEFMESRISKFDTDGNFSEYKRFEDMSVPGELREFGKNKFIGSQGFGFRFVEGSWFNRISLEIYDRGLSITDKIFEYNDKLDLNKTFNPTNIRIPLSCSDNEIFLSENNDDDYQINVYDEMGKKVRIIKKRYRKIKRTKEEREEFRNSYQFFFTVNGKRQELKADAEYKKAITSLDIDKYNRIDRLT